MRVCVVAVCRVWSWRERDVWVLSVCGWVRGGRGDVGGDGAAVSDGSGDEETEFYHRDPRTRVRA